VERSDRLERRLSSARDLGTVVGTMKSMAAVNINRFGRAAESVNAYVSNLARAMAALLEDRETEIRPETEGRRSAFVVFGSAHGLCGQFNEQIAAYAADQIETLGDDDHRVLAMGMRAATSLSNESVRIDGMHRIEGTTEVRSEVSRDVIDIVDRWHSEHDIDRVFVLFNHPVSQGHYEGRTRLLVPVDPQWIAAVTERGWKGHSIPFVEGDSEGLFRRFSRLYLFGLLEEAFLDSLASESISRLQAMEAAEQNIDDRLEELEGQLNRYRQRSITEELLDIVSGFEALQPSGESA